MATENVELEFSAADVEAILEALEFMNDGHYDWAMMMPTGAERAALEARLRGLLEAGRFPATLQFDFGEWVDYKQLIWWADREELSDTDEGREILARLHQAAMDIDDSDGEPGP